VTDLSFESEDLCFYITIHTIKLRRRGIDLVFSSIT